ncbi:MAG TPA: helix-turn-helix domain-containing protein [Vicinamibacteria bacterium]|nr:helix-turn-helix domain-containing protein [Vicinamibacteria bacterium]
MPAPGHRPQIQNHDVINRRSIAGFSRLADPALMSSHFAEGSLLDPRFNLEAAGDRLVLRDILASFERSLIVAALLAAGGNQKRAATALGVLPTTLQEKLKRFGLLEDRFGRRARPRGRAAHPGDNHGPRSEAGNTPKEEQPQ